MNYTFPKEDFVDGRFVPNAAGLVRYAQWALHAPHVYLWDGNGQYLTEELLQKLAAQYPDWYKPDRLAVRLRLSGRGIRGWDCIGLIKSYLWGDYSQERPDGYREETDYCTRTLRADESLSFGEINELPEVPGLVLWKQGHVGIYEGGGNVLECTFGGCGEGELIGGVMRTRLSERPWEKWVCFPGIAYPDGLK